MSKGTPPTPDAWQNETTMGLKRATIQTLQTALMFTLMACGGGGCGCAACGVEPIPGGFPIEQRIENSMQVRLTDQGVGFIEDNIDTLVAGFLPDGLEFAVPQSSGSAPLGVRYNICPDADCFVAGDIKDVDLIPDGGNSLHVQLQVGLQSFRPSGVRAGIPVEIRAILGTSTCQMDVDTDNGSRDYIGFEMDISFVTETQPARSGYTQVVVENAQLVPDESIEDADLQLSGCGRYRWLLNLFKGQLVSAIEDQIGGAIQGAIDSQLCTTQGEYGCPNGTTADGAGIDAVCRYADTTCVPLLIGTDGQGDLGASFLGGFSPGTHAPGQFLLASGGDGEAVNDGLSLFMYGGFLGTSRDFVTTPAHNTCVPAFDPPALPTIPRVATFRGNTVPGLSPTPHIGIGISESYLNQAMFGMYDGGLLCIGAGTALSQQLSTGLFGILVSSLKDLAFPETKAPIAMSIRPQQPPTIELGDGSEGMPLINMSMDELQIDFYVWSTERYVRFMTYEADLEIPINLSVVDGEIVPTITAITAANSVVTNSELLREDPAMVASTMEGVLTSFVSMAIGDLPGFALPDLMGLQLDVAEGGIRGIEESGEEFLGIFANLSAAAPSALTAPVETEMTLGALQLNRTGMQLETWGQGAIPSLTVHLDAAGPMGVEYEYSARLDGQPWSTWSTNSTVVLEDSILLLQARHNVEARARVVGERQSVDLSPSFEEFLVDITPPDVVLEPLGNDTRVTAADVVTEREDLLVRWRQDAQAEWSEWVTLGRDGLLVPNATAEIEVVDEAGNIGNTSAALIRGRPLPGAGCGCVVAGSTEDSNTSGALLALFFLGFVGLRRRRERGKVAGETFAGKTIAALRAARLLPLLPLIIAVGACDCGDTPPAVDGGPEMDMMIPPGDMMIPPDMGPGIMLEPGLLATHLDVAAASDGTLYFSGYSSGAPPQLPYGDLVIGRWNTTSMSAEWAILDGVPAEEPFGDPDGWRGGIRGAGPDVGRWTSIVEDGGALMIAYQDSDEGDLKFASGTPSGEFSDALAAEFSNYVIDNEGIAGAHTSMIQAGSGLAIAYLSILPATTTPARPTSRVRVAVSSTTSPTSAADWTISDVTTADIDCRAQFCPEGSLCTIDGMCVASGGTCAEECASGTECIGTACVEVLEDDYVEDLPVAVGLYNQLAETSSGLALVFYDRVAGNLMGAQSSGGTWAAPFLIDGYGRTLDAADPLDVVGDSGAGASLSVDGDTWHVTYVDGSEERLLYARVEGGTVTTIETVDDGSTDGSSLHPDGRHIVGDDSSVAVVGGEVRVAYQDATVQRAVLARRDDSGNWAIEILDDTDSAGYWAEQVVVGTTSYVAHWWRRQTAGDIANGVRVVTVD